MATTLCEIRLLKSAVLCDLYVRIQTSFVRVKHLAMQTSFYRGYAVENHIIAP